MFIFDTLPFDVLTLLLLRYVGIDSVSIIHLKIAVLYSKGLTGWLLNDSSSLLWRKLIWYKLKPSFILFNFDIETAHNLIFDTEYNNVCLFSAIHCLEKAFKELEAEAFPHYARLFMDVNFDLCDGSAVYQGFHAILPKILNCTLSIRYIIDQPTIETLDCARDKIQIKFKSRDLYRLTLTYSTDKKPDEHPEYKFCLTFKRWLDSSKYAPDCDIESKVQYLEYVRTKIAPLYRKNMELFCIKSKHSGNFYNHIKFQKAIVRRFMNMYRDSREAKQLRNLCILGIIPEERGKRKLHFYRLMGNPNGAGINYLL